MATNFRRFFEPPDLGSADLNRRVRLLRTIILFLFGFTLALGAILWLLVPQNWLARALVVVSLIVEIASFLALRACNLRLSHSILMYLLWGVLMTAVLLFDGIRGPSLLGQIMLIFLSGLLIGARFSAILAALTVAGNYLALLLEVNRGLPFSQFQLDLPSTWVFQSAYILLSFGLMLAVVRSISESLEDMRGSEQELKENLAELRQAQTQLEMSDQNLRRRERILETLRNAAEKLFRGQSLDEAIKVVLKDLGEAADVDRVYIFENQRQPSGELRTVQRYEWAAEGVEPQIGYEILQSLSYERSGLKRFVQLLEKNKNVKGNVKDLPQPEREFFSGLGVISLLIVPIFVGKDWWGFIGFDETKWERTWSPAEEDALRGAGGILGGAIERSRAEQALSLSEARYLAILQDQFDLIGRYKPDGRLTFVNDAYARYFSIDPQKISQMVIWTQVPPEGVEALKAKIASLTPEQPVSVTQSFNQRADGERRWVEWTDRGTFDSRGNLVEVQAVGRDIHEEVRLRKQLEENLIQMETQAMSDGLTGLLNRRAIMEHAEAEWQRAQRERRPLSLVVMDVDRLKEINDTFGHLVGDQALVQLAQLMHNGMRRYDWVGRWGGDEFLLVLPGTGLQEAREVAERLRTRFKQNKITVKGGRQVELHVSLGVASQADIDHGSDTLQNLLARADQALYKAKQGGRDQVSVEVSSQ